MPDLKGYHEFREPFIGGGSVALEVTKRYPGIQIWVMKTRKISIEQLLSTLSISVLFLV